MVHPRMLVVALCLLACGLEVVPPVAAKTSFSISESLGSKTAYEDRQAVPGAGKLHSDKSYTGPAAASPVFLFLLSRHGARLPTKGNINNVNALPGGLLKLVQESSVASAMHPWAASWTSPVQDLLYAEADLHIRGALASKNAGNRFAKAYRSLVPSTYYSSNYPADASYKPRAPATGIAWLGGFLGASRPKPKAFYPFVNVIDQTKDTLLRFYDLCSSYVAVTANATAWLDPWTASYRAQIGQEMAQRLNLSRPVTACEVDAVWSGCQHEASNLRDTTKLCSLAQADFERLNYYEDVQAYMTLGPADPLNYRIAAPLLAELSAGLKTAGTSSKPIAKARLLFGHAETVMPVASLLGLFGSDQPDEGTYTPPPAAASTSACKVTPSPMPDGWTPPLPLDWSKRVWQLRHVSPFSANIAFILYRMDGANATLSNHVVRMLYNEQLMPIPACGGVTDCRLDTFLDAIQPLASASTFDSICGNPVKYYAVS